MRLKEFLTESPDQFFKTKEEIEEWLKELHIENWSIHKDLTVSVDGSVRLSGLMQLEYLPVRFNIVEGNFECSYTGLRSLAGFPGSVGGNFSIDHCRNLLSLRGSPKVVSHNFTCMNCEKITSLEGAPEFPGQDYMVEECGSLTSLAGAPKIIYGIFSVYKCDALKSLAHGPEEVWGDFSCESTAITTLEGAPKIVAGDFHCDKCKLTSFTGIPSRIKGDLWYTDVARLQAKNWLSLLRVKDLRRLRVSGNDALQNIINKHLPEGDIFDCQQELMDAGLEEYAEL